MTPGQPCHEHQFPEEQTPEGVRILFPCLLCGLAAADGMEQAKRYSKYVELQLDGYQEREAACCPEDVGFEEWIAVLQKKLAMERADDRS